MKLFVTLWLLFGFAFASLKDVLVKPEFWDHQKFREYALKMRSWLEEGTDPQMMFQLMNNGNAKLALTMHQQRHVLRWRMYGGKIQESFAMEPIFDFAALIRQCCFEGNFLASLAQENFARKLIYLAFGFGLYNNQLFSSLGVFRRYDKGSTVEKQFQALNKAMDDPTIENIRSYIEALFDVGKDMFFLYMNNKPVYYAIIKEALKTQLCFFEISIHVLGIIGKPGSTNARRIDEMLTETHYLCFSRYLMNKWSQKVLTAEMVISYQSLKYMEQLVGLLFNGTMPEDHFFRAYLLQHQLFIEEYPERHRALVEDTIARQKRAVEDLDRILSLEALEEAKKLAATPAPKKKAKKTIPNTFATQPPKALLATRSDEKLTVEIVPVKIRTIIDYRDKTYGKLVIGEFVRTRFLKNVLSFLGFENTDGWSWEKVEAAIMAEVSKIPISRKKFLCDCIQWNKLRNAAAHPTDFRDLNILQELNQIKKYLGELETEQLTLVLTDKFNFRRPTKAFVKISGKERPNGFALIVDTQAALSCLNVYEFILQKVFMPACRRYQVDKVTLALLQSWDDLMPESVESLGLGPDAYKAFLGLAALRMQFAHPIVTLKQVKVYLNAILFEDPEYGPNILI